MEPLPGLARGCVVVIWAESPTLLVFVCGAFLVARRMDILTQTKSVYTESATPEKNETEAEEKSYHKHFSIRLRPERLG